jgi:large subunit ribosomal protein L4e
MKLQIINAANEKVGEIELPEQFKEAVNADLIARAVLAEQSRNWQPYGNFPEAGKRPSVNLSKRRHDYKGSYGHGISRTPRKIMSHRGTQFNWVGAFAPGTVGGRRAHPPKSWKIMELKINRQEERKAIRSALAASMSKEIVSKIHHVPENYPFAADDTFEKISKTKDILTALKKVGMEKELERTSEKAKRAGRGRMRGRKNREKKGVLIIVSDNCSLIKAARNIPGVGIATINKLNAELLAPGTAAGRPIIMTKAAIQRMSKEKIYAR